MERKKKGRNFKQERTRIFEDNRTDTYREKKKYKEPTQCSNCGALFINGRWTWEKTTDEIYEAVCPACQRIEDRYPAGLVEISGPFFEEHHAEIIHMIKNLERAESEEHPLERIMGIKSEEGITTILTTGIHLPRRLGDALKNAYEGELDISYDAENYVRISWHR